MKIAILTFDIPEGNVGTHRLLGELGGDVVGIMHSTALMPGRGNAEAIVRLGHKMGLRYGGAWQIHRWLARLGAWSLRLRGRPAGFGSLKALADEAGVPLVATRNIHGEASLATLRSWKPDLIVSNYFNQVIRPPVMAIPERGIINMHPALLPRNRGLMPCFWALAGGDKATGATVHWVDEGLDTGNIILQGEVAIDAGEPVISISQKCSACGAELLLEAIRKLREGPVAGFMQDEDRRTYHSWPSRGGIRRLRRRGHRYGSLAEMWAQVARPPTGAESGRKHLGEDRSYA
jgi:folate-dependent phosphoribosylglycinamide formyltransferase PurN